MADFLLEIGCEEIPARMLDAGASELAQRVGDLLVRERLAQSPAAESYSTPRRLAVLARGIAAAQADVEDQVLGPSLKVAYKDGKPTPAAEAFARKVGVGMDKLKNVTTPKGEYLAADVVKRGRSASELLAELLPKEIAGIYWPKNMYWRAGKPERFVRPVRWLVAMLDGEVVPLEFGGIRAGSQTRGHRVFHPMDQRVPTPSHYAGALEAASVFADRAAREQRIRKALDAATRAVAGARWREDADLLDTVVNLTEWPSAILGNFDREFLALPEEVLVTVMRDHQKYFAVEDAEGKLAPHFLAVLNTDGDPTGVIRHGNERVLRARFNDARFFWDTDQKISLRDRVESLKHVTFQKDLGSYYDKTLRVQHLASQLCQVLKDAGVAIRPGIVHKAALLAKTDLTTELVKEFTELQGIVGGLYARVQQLDPSLADEQRNAIATAIYDQYKPESTEDSVPRTVEGAVLSIADKADSIAGMFALGLIPSGSKDPFALRRQANGIVKILGEKKLRINLPELFTMAYRGYAGTAAAQKFTGSSLDRVRAEGDFLRERLEFYLRDVLGFSYDVVNAVLHEAALTVPPAVERAGALTKVRGTDDFEAISIAFKRIKNILRQAREEHKAIAEGHLLSAEKMQTDAERDLAKVVFERGPEIRQLSMEGRYDQALRVIAGTRPVIDKFFDKVMVMVDDESLRSARLGLLQALYSAFSTIADFSEIVTEKPKA